MRTWTRRMFHRLETLLGIGREDEKLREEFDFHLDMATEENLRAGMSPEEARRRARAAFGGTDWNRERVREERGGRLVEDLVRDFLFSLRSFGKRPVFSLAAVLTLALGIGMTTTMFTLVDAILLRPLPGSNTEGVVYLQRQSQDGEFEASPTPQLLRLVREHATSFSQVEAYTAEEFDLVVEGEPLRGRGARASVGFFTFLGVAPHLGRTFLPGDGRGGASPVVVLDHELWTERFGQREDIVGQTLQIGDHIHEVVGVLSPEFRIDTRSGIRFWIPEGAAGVVPEEGAPVEGALARLAPGVSLEVARAELDAIVRNNPLDQRGDITLVGRISRPEDLLDPTLTRGILILQIAAGLVLLIGCGNVTNLLLAQGENRSQEFALRSSLGARRGRLMRQLLVENLALGILGGVGGILLTLWALGALPLFLPPGFSAFSADLRTLLFALALSLVSVLVVGLLPAWKGSGRSLSETIKGGSPSKGGWVRRIGVRQFLVTSEVAMAFVLLVAAALLMKSFDGLRSTDIGFQADGLLTVRVELPEERYREQEAQRAFYDQLRENLDASFPPQLGVTTVASGLVDNLGALFSALSAEGGETRERQFLIARGVSPGYFELMGIPIHQGRDFDETEIRQEEPVVIVNDILAEEVFPGQDPTGQRLLIGEEGYRVVGVSGTVTLPNLLRTAVAKPQLFFPFRQDAGDGMTVIARITGDRATALERIREAVRGVDPTAPVMKVALVEDLLAESLGRERSNSFLMALFALTALVLGVVGIYGVVAYSVSQRIREIGVRLALGATSHRVVRGVVVGGMKTVLAGIFLGTVGAAFLGGVLSRLLYEVDPRDPQAFLLALAAVGGASLLAAWIPARKAAGTGPLESLKAE